MVRPGPRGRAGFAAGLADRRPLWIIRPWRPDEIDSDADLHEERFSLRWAFAHPDGDAIRAALGLAALAVACDAGWTEEAMAMSEEQEENGVPDADEERRQRFGRLPGRVNREDQVELTETDPPRGAPESAPDEREWPLRWGAGG